jgi:soluble lytic murein transglycosylase-like protein
MNFHLRQPFALAAAVALLALPLEPASQQFPQVPAAVTPHKLTPSPVPAVTAVAAAPVPNQKALARYIATRYDKPLAYAGDIVRTTFEEARKYALPPTLLLGMMEKESGFNAAATSSYGAQGLMQVVPRFHMDRLKNHETESSFKNPRTNIRVGAHILAEYVATHRSLDKALSKYSGSSRGYSRQVRSNWQKFEKMGHSNTPARTSRR